MNMQSIKVRLTQRQKHIGKQTHNFYGRQTGRKEIKQNGGKHFLPNTIRNDYRMETGGKQKCRQR